MLPESVIATLSDDVAAWSAFFVACLGILALLGTLLGIMVSRRDAKRARTLDYLSRLYGLDFAPLNAQVLAFLRTGDSDAFEVGAKLPDPPEVPPDSKTIGAAYEELPIELKARVILVLNFFEELSGSYRQGLLDEKVAANMLAPAIEQVWERVGNFIQYGRDQTAEEHDEKEAEERMNEWEALYNDLKAGSPPSYPLDRLDFLDSVAARFAGALAGVLIVIGLAAVGAHAVDHQVPGASASFLAAIAAVAAILACVAVATALAGKGDSSRRRLATAAIVGAAAVTLTAGLSVALRLPASQGARVAAGEAGRDGEDGRAGVDGERGPRGYRGEDGPRGRRGLEGPRGERGPRGYPGTLGS